MYTYILTVWNVEVKVCVKEHQLALGTLYIVTADVYLYTHCLEYGGEGLRQRERRVVDVAEHQLDLGTLYSVTATVSQQVLHLLQQTSFIGSYFKKTPLNV